MAKIKISDLAFELGCEGKELISFLQEKGIEAKRSNSSIEETDAEVARKHFGKSKAKAEEKPAKVEGRSIIMFLTAKKDDKPSKNKEEAPQ